MAGVTARQKLPLAALVLLVPQVLLALLVVLEALEAFQALRARKAAMAVMVPQMHRLDHLGRVDRLDHLDHLHREANSRPGLLLTSALFVCARVQTYEAWTKQTYYYKIKSLLPNRRWILPRNHRVAKVCGGNSLFHHRTERETKRRKGHMNAKNGSERMPTRFER